MFTNLDVDCSATTLRFFGVATAGSGFVGLEAVLIRGVSHTGRGGR